MVMSIPRRYEPYPMPEDFGPIFHHLEEVGWNFDVCPTKQQPTGPYRPEDVVAAIVVSRGNLSKAAQLLGRRRSKLKSYIDSHQSVTEILHDTRECLIDKVEDNAFEIAENGDPSMVRFILQTVGKNRGYTTRHEATGRDGEAIRIDTSGAKEQLRAFLTRENQTAEAVANSSGAGVNTISPAESVETGEAL